MKSFDPTCPDYDWSIWKQIRPSIQRFAYCMERTLLKHDHKGGWRTTPKPVLWRRLVEETRDLQTSIDDHFATSIIRQAIDAANYAMMIFDNAVEENLARQKMPKTPTKNPKIAFTIGLISVCGMAEGCKISCWPEATLVNKEGSFFTHEGWVWETPREAFLAIPYIAGLRDPAEFAVYELELPNGWSTDVSSLEPDGFDHLRVEAPLTKRCPPEMTMLKEN